MPGERDHLLDGEGSRGLAHGGRRVLDGLRFVDHHQVPLEFGELLAVAVQEAVARDQDVGAVFRLEHALLAVVDRRREGRRKARDLARPVDENGGGRDDEDLFVLERAGILEVLQRGNHLQGLAEAHVVGEKPAHAEAQVVDEPREAARLIGAKRHRDFAGHLDVAHLQDASQARLQLGRCAHFDAAVFARKKRTKLRPGVKPRLGERWAPQVRFEASGAVAGSRKTSGRPS